MELARGATVKDSSASASRSTVLRYAALLRGRRLNRSAPTDHEAKAVVAARRAYCSETNKGGGVYSPAPHLVISAPNAHPAHAVREAAQGRQRAGSEPISDAALRRRGRFSG